MATQTHQLNIKAKLDTSEVRAELDRLNQSRGPGAGGAQGQGAAQRTTQLLSKLDSTLSKLNATIARLAEAMGRPLPSSMSPRMASGSPEYFMAKAFDQMTDRQFADALRQIDKHRPNLMSKAGTVLDETELEVLNMRGIISDSTAAKIRAAKKAQPLNPPIVSENVMHVFPNGSYQLMPRDVPVQGIQEPSAPAANSLNAQAFRRQLKAFGIGTATSFVAGQLSQWGDLADNTHLNVASGILGGAGAGAMTGAIFGPWGAGIGAALGAVSQGALELVKSFKTLDEQVNKTRQLMDIVKVTSGGSLDSILAEEVVLGAPADAMLDRSQQNLNKLKSKRKGILARELGLSQGDQTTKTVEQLKQLATQREVIEKQIAAEENVISTINDRKRALDEEVQAGQKLAQAEREFAESIRRNEEAERIIEQWHSDSQSNIKSYREAQKQYMETMLRGRESTQDRMQRMGFEREVQMVKLGMWRGANAEDQFKNAKRLRTQIMDLNAEALSTDSPKRLEEIQKMITGMQGEFQHAMMMGQLLKDLGSPLQKLQLGSLTSLANRGVNMGEQTSSQRGYDKKMDEMIDVLQTIEENTRAAEKAVWE